MRGREWHRMCGRHVVVGCWGSSARHLTCLRPFLVLLQSRVIRKTSSLKHSVKDAHEEKTCMTSTTLARRSAPAAGDRSRRGNSFLVGTISLVASPANVAACASCCSLQHCTPDDHIWSAASGPTALGRWQSLLHSHHDLNPLLNMCPLSQEVQSVPAQTRQGRHDKPARR